MYQFAESIQRGILYLVKSNKDFYLEIVNLVKPDYFESSIHNQLYRIVTEYYDKYKQLPTDDLIVEEAKRFKRPTQDLSDYSDELEFINKLDIQSIGHPQYYLDLIENFAKREAMKGAIVESLTLIKEDKFGEVEDRVRQALMISRSVDNGQMYFDDLSDRWDRTYNSQKRDTFKTVLRTLNRNMEGGAMRKELCMVVAPAGVGKSLFLVNQGVTSLMENRKVLYVSLEMSEDRIAQRFDSSMTLLPQSRLKDYTSEVKERLDIFRNEFPDGKLVIKEFPTGRANVNNIRALLNQLRNYDNFVPDVLIVDYLELLRPVAEGMPEYQAQERIAQELRGLAVENNLLVWTATQTNRAGRRAEIITDAEMADSYGKVRPCDFVVSLNQNEEEYEDGRIRVYVIKSRNARKGFIVPMDVDYNTLRMTEGTMIEHEAEA